MVTTSEQSGRAATNWAGNITYRARALLAPRSVEELAAIIAREPRARVVGSRHSFNTLADTDGVQLSLEHLAPADAIEVRGTRVRVPAGARYGDLVPALDRAGLGLANLASLPHISVAGAVQTGTHGSGDRVGSLATQVAALEMVTGAGEHVRLERGDPDFDGSVVALGALGAVTFLELDAEPAYRVAQRVYRGLTWDAALADLDALTGAGDSVSLFTTWADAEGIDQVWVKCRADRPPADLGGFGGRPAGRKLHPIASVDPEPCTEQGGVPGPWYDRLPHFRLAFTPSVGQELQSEYLVPRSDAPAALEALRGLAGRIAPLLHVCEVRTVAADDLWLSPAQGAPTVGLHFTWLPDEAGVRALLPGLEAALPSSARPHWGKVSTLAPDAVRARFPRWADFARLRERLDPERRFLNPFLTDLLEG